MGCAKAHQMDADAPPTEALSTAKFLFFLSTEQMTTLFQLK